MLSVIFLMLGVKTITLGIRDLVRGGAPGAAAPGVFEDLLNEELKF